jgi:hypothetical protein
MMPISRNRTTQPIGTQEVDQPERASRVRKRAVKAPMTPAQVVEDIKAKLISTILVSVEGLSVRQAESVTGILYVTISRMRRGTRGGHLLEDLIKAALNVGVSVDVHIGKPTPSVRIDGRQNMFRPKQQT